MSTQLLSKLLQKGIRLSAADGQLKIQTGNVSLSAEDREALKANKKAILAYLQNRKISCLSYAQERLWFLTQLGYSDQYHISKVVKIRGNFDQETLQKTMNFLISRHESLRTAFKTIDGTAAQVIEAAPGIEIEQNDPGELSRDQQDRESRVLIREFVRRPFTLEQAPLIRFILVRLEETLHMLGICLHHIIADGWSMDILTREINRVYRTYAEGKEPQMKAVPIRYTDYAAWQREVMTEVKLGKELNYWKNHLAGYEELNLPADFPRPGVLSGKGGSRKFTLGKEQTRLLQKLCLKMQMTQFTLFMAGVYILLGRYSRQEDICLGMPVANRNRQEIEDLVGFFVNTLVIRIDTQENKEITVEQLLKKVKKLLAAAQDRQNVPFEKVVEILQPERDLNRTPIFRVLVNYVKTRGEELQLGDSQTEEVKFDYGVSKFDITFTFIEQTDGSVGIRLRYSRDLYEEETMVRMGEHLLKIITGLVNRPGKAVHEIELLTGEEKQKLLIDWNDTAAAYPADKRLHELFIDQVNKTADRVAIVCAVPVPRCLKKDVDRRSRGWHSQGQDRSITYLTHIAYRQLDEKSSQLAQLLRCKRIGPNQVVAVMSEPGPEIITAILAVLKCGACYLPIDPNIPGTRIRYLLTDSKATLLLTQTHLLEIAHKAAPEEMLPGILDIGMKHDSDDSASNGNPIEKMNTFNDTPVEGKSRKPGEPVYIIYTSGTTGKPKGVPISHENLVNYVTWFSGETHLTTEDKTVLTSSFAFDLGYTSLYPPLLRGAQLHILPQETYVLPDRFLDYLWFHNITYLKMTSSLFSTLVEDFRFSAQKCHFLRLAVLGGEAINTAAVEKAFKTCPHLSIMNHYGPTEVTIGCIARFIKPGEIDTYKTRPTIGKPIDNIKVFILGRYLHVLPIGMAGELCLSGAGVALGYLNQPALTSEKFIRLVPRSFKNPSKGITHGHSMLHVRLYRTGDLARWQADGNIEFMGRIDQQVKIRGFRIECGEIEAVLTGHPQIREAVVIAVTINNSTQLTAYYAIHHRDKNKPFKIGELRAYLRDKLPEYMIPAVFVAVKDIPLTPNGKVDRKALSKQEVELSGTLEYTAPRTETEKQLTRIWEEVLNKEPVGINDNFFELGGHSLLATRIISRINQDLKVEIPLRKLFEAPSIEGLSRVLAEQNPHRFIPISSSRRSTHLPLSYAQERLWFLAQLGYSERYHIPAAVKIKGHLDYEALLKAIRFIIARHESLRTGFKTVNDRAVQVIAAVGEIDIKIEQRDLSGFNIRQKERDSQDFLREFVHRPFKLELAPLMRVALIRMDRNAHILGICLHHIISDAWSRGLLTGEISRAYNAFREGKEPELAKLNIQYADYAVWQREVMTGEKLDKELSYWKKQLESYENLNLPTDYPRPKEISGKGGHARFRLDSEQLRHLTTLCQEKQVTLFTLLLTGVYILLRRYSGQGDICLGMPVANRNHPEIEDLVGFFVNTLVVRINIEEDRGITIEHLLKIVQEKLAAAQDRQNVPFEKVVEALQPERDLSRTPIFQVLVNYVNTRPEELQLGDSQSERMNFDYGISKFDLTVAFVDRIGGGLGIGLRYSRDLYKEGTIARMKGHLAKIINSLAGEPGKKPDEIELLTEQEKQTLLMAWNDTAAPYPKDQCIHELFGEQAGNGEGKVACVLEDRHITYGELDERSTGLAIYLQGKGVKPDVCVGICLERSIEMIIGIMGILKAGGAYVPIDAGYPAERIEYMLEDSNARVLVTFGSLENKVKEIRKKPGILLIDRFDFSEFSSSHLLNFSSSDSTDLAYIIYTSGSTGKPKGVMIQHNSLTNHIDSFKTKPGFHRNWDYILLSAVTFDASVKQMFIPLTCGAKVHICKNLQDITSLASIITRSRIDVINTVPSLMKLLIEELNEKVIGKRIKCILIGGEKLDLQLTDKIREKFKESRLINLYGPTETCVNALYYEIKEKLSAPPPIGKGLPNYNIFILDEKIDRLSSRTMLLLPIGIRGELYIAGDGLARGYSNQPELTAENFINKDIEKAGIYTSKPYSPLYRTGDLARWLPDGNIEFLGRKDHQVKIRGFRIECGEIEAVLTGHPKIKEVVVLARSINHTTQLIAYYLTAGREKKNGLEVGQIRDYLRNKLPEYMIPAVFVSLEAIPLTTTGKVDRNTLLKQEIKMVSSQEYASPRTETEKRLTRIWEEVLDVERVGLHDNFFELGGHSLLAIRIISRINQDLDVEIPLRKLFEAPSIEGLSRLLAESNPYQFISISSIRRSKHLPLSYAQERLWFLVQLGYSENYHIPRIMKMKGDLDKDALQKTMNGIVARHESLRTGFKTINRTAVQVIAAVIEIDIEHNDLCGLSKEEQENKCQDLIHEFVRRPFDLEQAPLIRILLIKLEKTVHILGMCLHHIISDAWSGGILTREISQSYTAFRQGKEPQLKGLKVQYADFAVWQREVMTRERLDNELRYWKKHLEGYEDLDLPTDYPRPKELSGKGGYARSRLDREQIRQLTKLCQEKQVTLFTLLMTGVYILLRRYAKQEDICMGMPVANRNHPEIEDIIGLFVNTLVIRLNIEENREITLEQLLKRVQKELTAAQDRQNVPFEKVVEALQPDRDLSRTPIFQVLVNYVNTRPEELQLGDSQSERMNFDYGISKFDLTVAFVDQIGGGLTINLRYSKDLFREETIRQMNMHLVKIIHTLAKEPGKAVDEMQLLTGEEKRKLLEEWNDTAAAYPGDKCLHELFEDQVKKTPDRIAAVGIAYCSQWRQEDKETSYINSNPAAAYMNISYKELNEISGHLAGLLKSKRIGSNDVVAIMIEPCLEMIASIFALLKNSAAFLPIDPRNPGERVNYLLADSKAKLLFTRSYLTDLTKPVDVKRKIPEILDPGDENPDIINREREDKISAGRENTRPDQPVYLIYTSGTTGKPKGVLIHHRNLVNYTSWFIRFASINTKDHAILTSSFSFDAVYTQFFSTLLAGGELHAISRETFLLGRELLRYIKRHGITYIKVTPSLFSVIVNSPDFSADMCHSLRFIMLGGEAIIPGDVQKARRVCPFLSFMNHYGPTETTIGSAALFINFNRFREFEREPTIGKPIGNTRVYIMDKHMQLVPPGILGELAIAGDGVGAGYVNRPELTAEKFLPDPFVNGQRLYRTGDLARWSNDGYIKFRGRIDHQVKIRGYRIELEEIENQLLNHQRIKEAVVIARIINNTTHLVAFYVDINRDKPLGAKEIKSYLKGKLPDYMIPTAFVPLEAMPLLANKKIDMKFLQKTEIELQSSREYAEARTETEKQLIRIWEEVLNKEPVGIYDNFFELGGHSLLAIRIISRINLDLDVEIPLRKLFESPTIEGLSGLLAESNPYRVIPISSIRRPAHLPLSYAQERLWFLVHLGYSEYYHIPRIMKIKGELDKEALQKTMNYMAARHESLRTGFKTIDGTAVQVITAALEIDIEHEDLSGLSKEEQEKECQDHIHEFVRRPFDLEKAPLIRIVLIKLKKTVHILGICLHHIISDAWSGGILTREISQFYTAFSQGKEPQLKGLKVQYADYAVWQREIMTGEKLEKELGYWKEHLAGYEDLNLPGDFPRPNELSGKGGRVRFRLEEEQTKQLTGLCQKLQITLFTLLMASVYILLAKYSRQEDICLGMTTANRNQREIEDIVGFFVNTLVIRMDRKEKGSITVERLLKAVKEELAAAQDRQDVPFGKIVEAIQPPRDLSRTPIFQILINYINTRIEKLQLGDSQLEGVEYDYGKSKFDLTFAFIDRTDGGLGIHLKYSRDLFEEKTIEKMGRHLLQIIFSLVAKPGQVPDEIELLTKEEKEKLLVEWNDTTVNYPGTKYLHELVEQQVKQGPDRIALMGPEPIAAGPAQNEAEYTAPPPVRHAVTYRLLNEKSLHLAQLLKSKSIAANDVVALMTEPCLEMITAILAVLRCGACYLPIDPENPGTRINYLLTDSNAKHLLTQTHLLETEDKVTVKDHIPGVLDIRDEHLYMNLNTDNRKVPVEIEKSRPGEPAYLIYTSGTTGKPRGVLVTHDNLVNYVTWFSATAGLSAEDKSILTSSFAFDLGYTSLYPPLVQGAQLYILPKERYIFADSLLEHIRVHGISYLKMTPSLFSTIVEDSHFSPGTCRSLRLVVLGGEAINAADVEKAFNKCSHLNIMNHYGPTEATIGCIAQSINPGEIDTYKTRPTIGKPIYNTRVLILDKYLQLLPVGLAGELCLCGAGAARGYLNHPELTSAKFVRTVIDRRTLTNDRIYRTGDLARWLENGNIEFLGRIDQLVKIRGFRIECGEIETVLCGYADVLEAVVIARDVNNSTQLVAYCVTAHQDKPLEINEIRGYLQDRLPMYMIPAAFVCLEAIPLTPNGKVDRKTLLTHEVQLQSSSEYTAPRTETEKQLTRIWEEVLGVERVGIYDDFFELGGHSLLAIQMVTKIRQRMEVDCPLKNIFDHATVSELAALFPELAGTPGDNGNMLEANIPGKNKKPNTFIPLSEGQITFWLIWLAKKDTWNLYRIYNVRGPFDRVCLEQAFNVLLQRHESPWARFSRRRPLQEIIPSKHITLSVIDLKGSQPQEQKEKLEKISRDVIVTPFDLTSPPLLRLCLVQLEDHWYKLILAAPHIVMDAAGFHTLIDEFMSLYKALISGNPLPPKRTEVGLSDYVYWKHAVSKQVRQREVSYWQQKLERASLLKVPDLYLQRPNKKSHPQRIKLDKSLLAALAKISQQHRVSLQMSLFAIIAMVLHRITSQKDISISIVFENRLHQDIKHLVSSMVTMVPIRISLSQETSFADLTDLIKHTTIEAYDHIRGSSFIPLSLLTRVVRPDNHRFVLKLQERFLRFLTWIITRLWFSPKAYPYLFYAVLLGIDRKAGLENKSRKKKSGTTGDIPSTPDSIPVALNFMPDFYQSRDNSSYRCGDVGLSPGTMPIGGETRKALQSEQAGVLYLAFSKNREGQPRFTVKGKMFTPSALQHIINSFDRVLREVVKNPRITLQEMIEK